MCHTVACSTWGIFFIIILFLFFIIIFLLNSGCQGDLGERRSVIRLISQPLGIIQRFAHAQSVLQISIPVPSCTGTVIPRGHCVLGLPQ